MEVLRRSLAGHGRVEILRARQVTALLCIQATVARQSARDLTRPIGPEVEADTRILVADRGQWLALVVDAHEGDHELVGHALVVGLFHPLHGIDIASTFALPENHRMESLRDAFPAAIAVHGVITAVYGW